RKITKDFRGVLTVENDQTYRDGKMKTLLSFFAECEIHNLSIRATFDIGNGCWTGEDPYLQAKKIQPYAGYVHVKDVDVRQSVPQAASIGEGVIPWREILRLFPEHVPVALEYPCGNDPFAKLETELLKLEKTGVC
ncbi:MAG TPA: hypothetical protein VFK27_02330, partial [Bacillales bacterium]|nr:hypothetical protein [Bacillales bacterium]